MCCWMPAKFDHLINTCSLLTTAVVLIVYTIDNMLLKLLGMLIILKKSYYNYTITLHNCTIIISYTKTVIYECEEWAILVRYLE